MPRWVDDHGAHLLDYAAGLVGPARAPDVVAAVLATCRAQGEPPAGVSPAAWLLGSVRQRCHADPGHRTGYAPEPALGPGVPDPRSVGRAWTLADPLGTEALRLMYRHELALPDVAHVLDLSVEDAGRLTTRTQDLVEIMVSAMDALAHGRPACRELAPLLDALFPDPPAAPTPEEFADGRMALTAHIVGCAVCKRPINIRYTVPQMTSHPPLQRLTDESRRLLEGAVASPPPDSAPPWGFSSHKSAFAVDSWASSGLERFGSGYGSGSGEPGGRADQVPRPRRPSVFPGAGASDTSSPPYAPPSGDDAPWSLHAAPGDLGAPLPPVVLPSTSGPGPDARTSPTDTGSARAGEPSTDHPRTAPSAGSGAEEGSGTGGNASDSSAADSAGMAAGGRHEKTTARPADASVPDKDATAPTGDAAAGADTATAGRPADVPDGSATDVIVWVIDDVADGRDTQGAVPAPTLERDDHQAAEDQPHGDDTAEPRDRAPDRGAPQAGRRTAPSRPRHPYRDTAEPPADKPGHPTDSATGTAKGDTRDAEPDENRPGEPGPAGTDGADESGRPDGDIDADGSDRSGDGSGESRRGSAGSAGSAGSPAVPKPPGRRSPLTLPSTSEPAAAETTGAGYDTPLYHALRTQAWAREVLARAAETTAATQPIPVTPAAPPATPVTPRTGPTATPPEPAPPSTPSPAPSPATAPAAGSSALPLSAPLPSPLPAELTGPLPAVLTEPADERPGRTRDRRPGGARHRPLSDEPTRPVPVLSRERPIARNTSLKIAVIVLAGAAGTVTGIKILGPALDGEAPARSLQSVAVETARSDPGTQGIFDDPGAADDQSLGNGPLRIPATVTLDEFGRGTMTLTVSEGAEGSINWRISAPGLVVTPSKGTLKRGGSGVVSVRALRVRYWCGDPEAVTAPLTVHGPSESITTTVRWRTC
ncbi:hypothetical protein [Microtetraspora fusca]|uniref:hypothetical protein n=1 Tax=Microtetraspora fusca TaxID=1997 RepID=UPI0012F971A0|nr:hypothetical protein [Microtetraspora fusca]